MPAERAITSSYLRLSETSVAIAAINATKGTACCMIIGTRNADTASASWMLKPDIPTVRLENSVKSISVISAYTPRKYHAVMVA